MPKKIMESELIPCNTIKIEDTIVQSNRVKNKPNKNTKGILRTAKRKTKRNSEESRLSASQNNQNITSQNVDKQRAIEMDTAPETNIMHYSKINSDKPKGFKKRKKVAALAVKAVSGVSLPKKSSNNAKSFSKIRKVGGSEGEAAVQMDHSKRKSNKSEAHNETKQIIASESKSSTKQIQQNITEHQNTKETEKEEACGVKIYIKQEKCDLSEPSNESKFICFHCSKSFTQKHYLVQHFMTHSEERPFACEYCAFKFKSKGQRKLHKKKVHFPNEKNFKCDICGKNFLTNVYLTSHMQVHSSTKAFKCEFCKYTCKRKSDLVRHKVVHDGNLERELVCFTCKKVFTSKSGLKLHVRKHLKLYSVFCQYCNKGFYDNKVLNLHVNSKHTGKTMFICDICSRPCYCEASLRKHKESHTVGFKEKNLVACEKCGKMIKSNNLQTHINKNHNDSGENKWICDICGKNYYDKGGLAYHMNTHTGVRPYECQFCNEAFAHPTTLKGHLRRHTGERPFKCSHCDKTFTHGHSLKIHMSVHTGAKPFNCSFCEKTFTTKSLLNSHVKSTHGR